MLIWFGGTQYNSGGATIQGFASIASCEKATEAVHKFYDGILSHAQTKCISVENTP